MDQKRIDSLMEALTNTFIGFCVTLLFSPIIYHTVGVKMSGPQQAHAVFWFTILSVVRSYILRRIFKNKPVWATIKAKAISCKLFATQKTAEISRKD